VAEFAVRGLVMVPAGTKDWAGKSVTASAIRVKETQNEPRREEQARHLISHLQKARRSGMREIRRKVIMLGIKFG